jgi:Sigma-70, region 4
VRREPQGNASATGIAAPPPNNCRIELTATPRGCPLRACPHHVVKLGARGGKPAGSCTLLYAGAGDMVFEEIGRIVGLSRERIRQIEAVAMGKLRKAMGGGEVSDWLPDERTALPIVPDE